MKAKLIVLAIDGADFDLIDKAISAGMLPNFAHRRGRGCFRRPVACPAAHVRHRMDSRALNCRGSCRFHWHCQPNASPWGPPQERGASLTPPAKYSALSNEGRIFSQSIGRIQGPEVGPEANVSPEMSP